MAVKIDTLETVPPHVAIAAVRLDFMTDDVNEAEEKRIQTLASDCVAEIRNSNESGWVAV